MIEELSTGTKGAVSELAVAADLMRMGFDVFRNLSPTGEWDLIVYRRTGRTWDAWPVQVKSSWSEQKWVKRGTDISGRKMILAVVVDGVINYDPPVSS